MKAILNENLFRVNQTYSSIDWSSESKANKSIKEKGLPIFMDGWVITQKNLPSIGDWFISYQNNALYEWKIKCEIDALPWCNVVIATIGFKIDGVCCVESDDGLKYKQIQEFELDEKSFCVGSYRARPHFLNAFCKNKNRNLIIKNIVYATETK